MELETLRDRISNLGRNGIFGEGNFLKVVNREGAVAAPQFASQLSFLVVEIDKDSKIERRSIVCKIQPKTEGEREMQDSDTQFTSEVAMYTEILPLLGGYEMDLFPKYIYGEASGGRDPNNDLVVLEDLSDSGYTTIDSLYLDGDTVKMCLRELGRFHGLTYRAKKTQLNEIQSAAERLSIKKFNDDFNVFLTPCIERGFKIVRDREHSSMDILNGALDKMKRITALGFMKATSQPKEPFAAFIHGDFNKNNLMFRCNSSKTVESVKFLDLQRSLYADPSLDIAFFLYMNTTQETRDNHWDDFFKTYWEGLVSIEADPGFTYDEFLDNFAPLAISGYLPCSFFLPMMMQTEQLPIEEYLKWDMDEKIERMVTAGGAEGDKATADIVQDLLDRGYLEKFLLNFS